MFLIFIGFTLIQILIWFLFLKMDMKTKWTLAVFVTYVTFLVFLWLLARESTDSDYLFEWGVATVGGVVALLLNGIGRWVFGLFSLVTNEVKSYAHENSAETRALYLCQQNAGLGNTLAQYELGERYETGLGLPQDDAKAAYWYEKSADQENSQAQYRLGSIYYYGQGVQQDTDKAIYWWGKAASQGSASATRALNVAKRARAD